MSKREWPLRYVCAHEGCNESVTYSYPSLKELNQSFEVRIYGGGSGKWKCLRHANPDSVLSPMNPETRYEITSEQKELGRYFGSFGLVTGPGFKVWAKDFPDGTKLIVTARVELPLSESASTDTKEKT